MDSEGIRVISENVLPFLKWNDILRLRRVCKTTKTVTDNFVRNLPPEQFPASVEVEINETDKPISQFLQMDLPLPRIYLNNATSGADFFQSRDFLQFMEKFGNRVTHLHLCQMSRFLIRNEWKFFRSSLKSLCHLEVERVRDDLGRVPRKLIVKHLKAQGLPVQPISDNLILFPLEEMSNLKCVKFRSGETRLALQHACNYAGTSLIAVRQLEHLCVPSSVYQFKVEEEHQVSSILASLIKAIEDRIELARVNPGYKSLKVLEFDESFVENAFSDELDQEDLKMTYGRSLALYNFLNLAKVCVSNGISLMNLNAAVFQGFLDCRRNKNQICRDIGQMITSLVNLHSSMVNLELPNLEKLVIHKSSQSSIFEDWHDRAVWPKLRTLRICANSDLLLLTLSRIQKGSGKGQVITIVSLKLFWNFFFSQVTRPALTELSIEFPEGFVKKMEKMDCPLPETIDIVSSCPNLTKLTLVNWLGSDNLALSKLWCGLERLEDVCLDSCENLGALAFVGENGEDPAFLKLKYLKKLSLKGLDKMPKVTDLIFALIFRHLKLKEFILQSEQPLKSITVEGIRCLLTGDFATSVERFPFQHFQLDETVSPSGEAKKVEAQFRSFHRI